MKLTRRQLFADSGGHLDPYMKPCPMACSLTWPILSCPSSSPLSGWLHHALRQKKSSYTTEQKHYRKLFGDKCLVQVDSITKIVQQEVKLELDTPPTHTKIKVSNLQVEIPQSCRYRWPSCRGLQARWQSPPGSAKLNCLLAEGNGAPGSP